MTEDLVELPQPGSERGSADNPKDSDCSVAGASRTDQETEGDKDDDVEDHVSEVVHRSRER